MENQDFRDCVGRRTRQRKVMQRKGRESKSRMFSNGHSMDKPRFTGKWKQKSPAQDEERLQRRK